MKIFCMDIRTLVPAMRELGHEVLAVVPEQGGLFNLPELATLDGKCRLQIRDLRQIGEDIRLIARPR